ncbi:MAG: hypothetical protein KGL39_29670 [Patescibacteria group bacterium]|nr:hypothetical protein [Patescibacteria group bacterium]
MASPVIQSLGSFSVGRKTAALNTAFAVLIPPYGGGGQAPGIGNVGLPGGSAAKPRPLTGVPHITSFILDTGGTAHTLTILRPMNYTWFSADAAAAQAVVALTADPGSFSTAYNYPLANGQTAPDAANDLIGSGDYCVYQDAKGRWVLDTATEGYGATVAGSVTMTANLPTGGVKAGGLFYLLGQAADLDPATGLAHLQFDTTVSARLSYTDPNGLWCGLHPGDPLVIYNPNGTAADIFQLVSGFYAAR